MVLLDGCKWERAYVHAFILPFLHFPGCRGRRWTEAERCDEANSENETYPEVVVDFHKVGF